MPVGQLKRPSLKRPPSSGGADGETTLFEVREVRYTRVTPPIAEILCVKNGRAIVVCGFLMKYVIFKNMLKV